MLSAWWNRKLRLVAESKFELGISPITAYSLSHSVTTAPPETSLKVLLLVDADLATTSEESFLQSLIVENRIL